MTTRRGSYLLKRIQISPTHKQYTKRGRGRTQTLRKKRTTYDINTTVLRDIARLVWYVGGYQCFYGTFIRLHYSHRKCWQNNAYGLQPLQSSNYHRLSTPKRKVNKIIARSPCCYFKFHKNIDLTKFTHFF
jgi:hypothetical protein